MPDLMMLVDTAVTVPVNLLPLIDDTDFKTRETAIAYNASGMDLVWNFVTAAGVITQTAVTPTTGGDYDWSHVGDGIYKIELPASGGASVNNDTEGFGWFTGFVTGVLPWRGPVVQFSPANVVNSLVPGSDKLEVDVAQWLGTAAATPTTAGVPEVDVTYIAGNATAATNLSAGARAVVVGTCASGSSTTSVVTTLTEATDDHYNGAVIVFTSGALTGQKTDITDYNGTTKTLTVTALTESPAENDTFVIV
jgi:hypothetical protein